MKLKYVIVVLLLFGFINGASAGEISFNAVTNVITVTGFSQANPCTFLDVYNADVTGGWGVITKQGAAYYLSTRLKIGNISQIETWFADEKKHVYIDNVGGDTSILLYKNATFRLGNCISHINQTTKDGCCVIFHNNDVGWNTLIMGYEYYPEMGSGHLELYSTNILIDNLNTNGYIAQLNKSNFYNSNFDGGIQLYNLKNIIINNNLIQNTDYALFGGRGDFTNIKVENAMYVFYFDGRIENQSIRNIEVVNSDYLVHAQFSNIHTYKYDLSLIDLISTNKTWYFYFNRFRGKIKIQNTFNLETTPNAKITIMNHIGVVYQGCACDNGIVDEQILMRGYYTQSTGNVLNSQNPYSIEIKKMGYHTYAQEFTLNGPIKWHIRLVPNRIEVGSDIIRANRR